MTSQWITESQHCALIDCALFSETNKTVYTPPKLNFVCGAGENAEYSQKNNHTLKPHSSQLYLCNVSTWLWNFGGVSPEEDQHRVEIVQY